MLTELIMHVCFVFSDFPELWRLMHSCANRPTLLIPWCLSGVDNREGGSSLNVRGIIWDVTQKDGHFVATQLINWVLWIVKHSGAFYQHKRIVLLYICWFKLFSDLSPHAGEISKATRSVFPGCDIIKKKKCFILAAAFPELPSS